MKHGRFIRFRTDLEIIEETNELARLFYKRKGYQVPDNHKFYEFNRINYHPHEQEVSTTVS